MIFCIFYQLLFLTDISVFCARWEQIIITFILINFYIIIIIVRIFFLFHFACIRQCLFNISITNLELSYCFFKYLTINFERFKYQRVQFLQNGDKSGRAESSVAPLVTNQVGFYTLEFAVQGMSIRTVWSMNCAAIRPRIRKMFGF